MASVLGYGGVANTFTTRDYSGKADIAGGGGFAGGSSRIRSMMAGKLRGRVRWETWWTSLMAGVLYGSS